MPFHKVILVHSFLSTYVPKCISNIELLCQNYKIPSQNRKALSSLQVARCIDALSIKDFRIRSEALHKTLQLPTWVRYEICTIWKSCKIFSKLCWSNLPLICCAVFGFPTWHPKLIEVKYVHIFKFFTIFFVRWLWHIQVWKVL